MSLMLIFIPINVEFVFLAKYFMCHNILSNLLCKMELLDLYNNNLAEEMKFQAYFYINYEFHRMSVYQNLCINWTYNLSNFGELRACLNSFKTLMESVIIRNVSVFQSLPYIIYFTLEFYWLFSKLIFPIILTSYINHRQIKLVSVYYANW